MLNPNKLIPTAVTDITRHIQENTSEEIMKYFEIKKIREESERILIDVQSEQSETVENVSEITGTAIPMYYESTTKGKIQCIRMMPRNENKTLYNTQLSEFALIDEEDSIENLKQYNIKEINIRDLSNNPDELLYIANRWCSFKSGFLSKIKQIKVYDWLSKENLNHCKERIDSLELLNVDFEKKYQVGGRKELFNRSLIGFIDCIDRNNIYEFKCVQKLENEHFIQLAIYAYMNEVSNGEGLDYNYYLYNILTDEMFSIIVNLDKLKKMMEFIMYQKYYASLEKISDDEFIKKMCTLIKK